MRKFLCFFFLLNFISLFSQKKKSILEKFDFSGMKTSILVQENPLIDLENYNTNTNNVYAFYQGFKAISQGDLQHRLVSISELKKQTKQSYFSKIIPIKILISEYETINKEAFTSGSVTNDVDGFLIRTNNSDIFEKHHLNLASALRDRNKGLLTKFELKKESIFNTTSNKIIEIQIDFGNEEGFKIVKPNQKININYSNPGHKTLKYRITLENSDVITMKSIIEIVPSKNSLNKSNMDSSLFSGTTLPDLAVYGETSYVGVGEYELFLSTDPNAVLDKPIFIVDGFDPFDRRPITGYTDSGTGNFVEGIYDLFDFTNTSNTTENLADLVRAEGFDVFILNFPVYTRSSDNTVVDGGVDYVERNAMLLVDLINYVNSQKVGNEPNVVIGPSMGGLISQYALNYMENQSLNHDTRLWIAFDSPLQGANVPIGFQHQFNYLANGLNDFWFIGNQNVEALQPVVNGMMKSNAARQMLTDQLEAHITNSDGVTFNSNLNLPQTHSFHNILFNRMHNLTTSGYPENLRKVAITNGSGLGNYYQDKNGVDIVPGREIVNVDIDVTTGTEAFLDVNFTTYASNSVEVSDVYIDFAWYIPAFDVESNAISQSYSYSNGVDSASGGLFDLSNVTNDVGTSGIAGEFVTALQTDYFNFIPTVSAMAIEFTNDEIDWFHVSNNANTSNETPFDAWYMPNTNEPHVTLTQANVNFAWNEIVLQDPASNTDNLYNERLKLINNLVDEKLRIKNNVSNLERLEISIFSISGKKVFHQKINSPSNLIEIPISLEQGVYFVKFSDFPSINQKIIVY